MLQLKIWQASKAQQQCPEATQHDRKEALPCCFLRQGLTADMCPDSLKMWGQGGAEADLGGGGIFHLLL